MAGESTRNKMYKIVQLGGELVAEYDPERITHIVSDADEGALLKELKLKSLLDIPKRIHTVRWDWVVEAMAAKPRKRVARTDGDVSGRDEGGYEYVLPREWDFPKYGKRVNWQKAVCMPDEKEDGHDDDDDARELESKVKLGASGRRGTDDKSEEDEPSHISDFTQDKVAGAQIPPHPHAAGLPSPPSSPNHPQLLTRQEGAGARGGGVGEGGGGGAGPSTSVAALDPSADPLAEFYAQARAERDAEKFGDADGESGDASGEPEKESASAAGDRREHGPREVHKRGFLCDDKDARRRHGACPNQDVVDKLEELKALHSAKPSKEDKWRVYALNRAIGALRRYPTRIRSVEEAKTLRGVGDKTAMKIMEVIQTGKLERIRFEMTEDVLVCMKFTGIYNVGINIARMWYNCGCRTLEDVAARKGGIELSAAQEIGLRYYDDINQRIPRAEVQEIYDIIQKAALKLDPKLFIRVMGSFRRGKADCGDIDVLITRPTDDGRTHRGILRRLLAKLQYQGLITEHLSMPKDFDDLELVYHGLCRRDSRSLRRRIDFLCVPWTSRGAALLYYTGDDIFNRSLRLKANKMGYSLNQRGLYAGVVRDPNDWTKKLNEGNLVASESEEEIFRILGVPWQEPHERIRH
ncbi:hypothetical protein C8Q76DRAFT_699578 [Earliella scabrosa]|nr:hypothetical protein C8Q76DRAFT_699578 [Earliella scabrosa]